MTKTLRAACRIPLLPALTLALLAGAAHADLPRQSAVPGGVVLIDIPDAVRGDGAAQPAVTFEGKRVMVLRRDAGWVAVVGIPLARSPGPAQVEIRQGSAPLTRGFTIEGKAYQPTTSNWQYYLDPPTGTEASFLALVKQMKSVTGADPKRVVS